MQIRSASSGVEHATHDPDAYQTRSIQRPNTVVAHADRPIVMSEHEPRPWFWEGNVQETLGRHLAGEGWTVREMADTETKAPGTDLLATKGERWLAIEVKGYPSTTYDHGPKRGLPKPTQPASQARQWFSHSLLGLILLRDRRPDAEIAVCFPAFTTYESLVKRTRHFFELLGFGVYLVGEDGSVQLQLEHGVVAAFNQTDPTSESVGQLSDPAKESGMAYRKGPWGVSELHEALDAFEAELKEAGLAQNSIRTYVDRSRNFVRWLDGDYEPRGPNQ